MLYLKPHLYLTFDECVAAGIKAKTLENAHYYNRSGWSFLKDPRDGRCVLVQYAALRDKYKAMITAYYGDVELYAVAEAVGLHALEVCMAEVKELQEHYRPGKAQRLAEVAAALRRYLECRDVCGWGGYTREVAEGAYMRHLTLKSVRTLRRKARKYHDEGTDSLIHGNCGNRNRGKVSDELRMEILQLYTERNRTCKAVWERLLALHPELPVGYATVWRECHHERNEGLIRMLRQGVKTWREAFDPVIHRERPSAPGLLWTMDGTPVELWYRDDKGKPRRAYMVWVNDCYDASVAGWAVSSGNESGDLVRFALRAACHNVGYLPAEIQTDNGSAFKAAETQSLFKQIGIFTPAQIGNARAKLAESWWSGFNTRYLAEYPNWSGTNITARGEQGKLSPARLAELLRDEKLPDLGQLTEQVGHAVRAYNASLPEQPEQYKHCKPFTPALDQELYWVWRTDHRSGKRATYTYTNRGLAIKEGGDTHRFRVYDAEMLPDLTWYATSIGVQYHVKCDPTGDYSGGVLLYHATTGKLAAHAQPMQYMPMATLDRKPGDKHRIVRHNERRDELRERVEAEAAAIRALPQLPVPESLPAHHPQRSAAEYVPPRPVVLSESVDDMSTVEEQPLPEDILAQGYRSKSDYNPAETLYKENIRCLGDIPARRERDPDRPIIIDMDNL